MLKSLIKDEKGQSSLEYGLIIGVVVVGLIMALGALGTQLNDVLESVRTSLAETLDNVGVAPTE